MANRYWVGGSATWDGTAGTKWATTSGGAGGAAVPTAADDVFVDASSGSVTVTVSGTTNVCRSLNFTGFTGTFSHPVSTTITIGDATAGAGNVALLFSAGMTYTVGNATINLVSTSATQQTITTAGKLQPSTTINGAGSSYVLTDNYTHSSTARILTIATGTFDAGGFNLNVGKFFGSGSGTKTINMGSGIWTLTGTSSVWGYGQTVTNVTFNPGTSKIVISDTSATGKTFTSSTYTYNDIDITGGVGSGTVTMQMGSGYTAITFNAFTIINPGTTVTFSRNATYNVSSFTATGSSVNHITLNSDLAATAFILSKSSGTVSCDYLTLQDSTATGGAAWYAGANSTNTSNNSGWIFTAPSLNSGNFFQLF